MADAKTNRFQRMSLLVNSNYRTVEVIDTGVT